MTPLSGWTLVGALWTCAAVVLLVRGARGPLGSRWSSLLAGALLAGALSRVTGAIAEVEAMAGGLQILDTRYPYGPAEVLAFAEALGEQGRGAYAAFQLGVDTLAPPAFACFVGSAACSTLSRGWRRAALVPIAGYLAAVVLANALMPVLMLRYPALASAELQILLHAVPWLDFAKYSLHLAAWAVIVGGWLFALARRLRRGPAGA